MSTPVTRRAAAVLRRRRDGRAPVSAPAVPEQPARPAPEPPQPPQPPAPAESPVRSALAAVATVGPPLTIITALLYYFGWARSNAQASAMGLHVSLFGYTTQDYLLRSVSTLYLPLLAVAVVGLGFLSMHERIAATLSRPGAHRALRAGGKVVLAAGLLIGTGAVVAVTLDRASAPLMAPSILAGGAVLAAYGAWLARAAATRGGAGRTLPAWDRALRALLVGGVITLALFWQLADYAGVVGRGYANDVTRGVPSMPRATAFSAEPLGIQAPGVQEEPITGASAGGEAARYRTTGLRFFVSSGDRLFLLHDGWSPGEGTVIILPDDGEVRWQFSR